MKNLLKSVKILTVVGVMVLNINPLLACLPHLECDGGGGVGTGNTTCYSTWDTNGTLTIHECGMCEEEEDVKRIRDKSKC